MDKVRVLRVLEYAGTREAVEQALSRSQVPNRGSRISPELTLHSGIVGEHPEILIPDLGAVESETEYRKFLVYAYEQYVPVPDQIAAAKTLLANAGYTITDNTEAR